MKTRELTGDALNWAVAKCEGYTVGVETTAEQPVASRPVFITRIESKTAFSTDLARLTGHGTMEFATMWAQGGPIIERESINVIRADSDDFHVEPWAAEKGQCQRFASEPGWDRGPVYEFGLSNLIYGPTPLIAAMRCYVASKLGDDIDIPEGLA